MIAFLDPGSNVSRRKCRVPSVECRVSSAEGSKRRPRAQISFSTPVAPAFCPGGTSENSPAFQRRDQSADKSRPEGTAENQGLIRPSLRDLSLGTSKPPRLGRGSFGFRISGFLRIPACAEASAGRSASCRRAARFGGQTSPPQPVLGRRRARTTAPNCDSASQHELCLRLHSSELIKPRALLCRFYRRLARARLQRHNAGEVPHTAKFRPWRIKTAIAFTDRNRALRFERYLKTASGRAFAKKRL